MFRLKQDNLNTKDFWNEQYKVRIYGDAAVRHAVVSYLVVKSHPLDRGGIKVLDIGCGLGEIFGELKKQNYQCYFYGTDFSEEGIKRCQEMFPATPACPKPKWIVANFDKQPFPDKEFDTIVCSEVIEHLDNPWGLINEMKRLIKDDGKIILSTPRGILDGCNEHVWAFEDRDIQDFFKGKKIETLDQTILENFIICKIHNG
jgi:ubiquinone/menaquinone biosynthesis C-methylase UbiE